MVTEVDVYQEIRRLQLEGVVSKREAARRLGISRNTVKKYWEGDAVPWEKKTYEREPSVITPEVRNFIVTCLDEDDSEGVKKQKHTARRIYDRLVNECGFKGGESSIRRAVHELKLEKGAQQVFVPLSFFPGDSAQIDWGEATVYMDGKRQKVNLFCARLCYSCAPYVIAYRKQNLECFLDAIIRTFKFFGGVPKRIIFDNAKVAVKSGFGAHAAAQDDYAHLAAHYGFKPIFCNPSSGNEKGLVENLVGYIRRNVCVPLPRVKDLDELNAKLLEQCLKYQGHKVESRPEKVGEMLKGDRKSLQKMPRYIPDISKKAFPNVNRYCIVIFDKNRYSVPCKYRGKSVTVKGFPNHIEIWYESKMIARHIRLYGSKEESLDLRHYLPILQQKGRAIRYARPVQHIVPVEFIDWMENQHLTAKEMVEKLEMCLEYGYEAVMRGDLIQAAEHPIPDPVTVESVDLSEYDGLCGKEAAVS